MAFILTRSGAAGQWLVNRDGSGLRQFLPRATWAYWSGDGQWLYYTATRGSSSCIEKAPLGGGAPVPVRCDDARAPAVSRDGSTLYFVTPLKSGASVWDWEIRKATPEDGPSRVLARVAGARVPVDYLNIHTILSPDDRRLALPLSDGVTSNLWALTVEGGPLRPLTDFGDKGVVIARRVSWSRDGRFIYAAVAETEADIVLLTGLLSQ